MTVVPIWATHKGSLPKTRWAMMLGPSAGATSRYRGHVHIHADAFKLAGRDVGKVAGIGAVFHGRIAGELGKRRFEAGHDAALLIDGDEQGRISAVGGIGLCGSAQFTNLVRRLDVAAEQDQPPHMERVDGMLEFVIQSGTVEADHEPLASLAIGFEPGKLHIDVPSIRRSPYGCGLPPRWYMRTASLCSA
jgi:hypothetical protein